MVTEVEQRLIAQIYIRVDGTSVSDTEPELLEELGVAIVESSAHLPDMATLEFHNRDLHLSDAERFKIGQEIRIALGDSKLKKEVFVGEITDVELDISMSARTPLLIRAYDRAHRLHRGRFTRSFTQMTDSDVARKIAGEVGLAADVESTTEVHEYVLQDNETNWDFLQARARRLGFDLLVRDKALVFKPPAEGEVEAEPVPLSWPGELYSFRARMVTAGQVDEVRVRGWDPVNKKAVEGKATRARLTPRIGETRSGGEAASDAFRHESRFMVAREPVYSQTQADALAQAVLDELGNSFVLAEGVAMGNPRIRLGSEVELEKVGKQFRGTYVVTEVRHAYRPEGYRIEFKITGRRSTDIVSLLTEPRRPGVHILTGIVTNNKDERDLGRVKVKLPVLGDDVESHWCRLVTIGAGPERGMQYTPEIDDEVLVMGADINQLYVLGGMWNTRDMPPQKSGEAVSAGRVVKRIIRSRTGHEVLLDDSDGGGGITILDSTKKNKIVIDTANNSLELAVEGDIKLQAGGKLTIEAQMDATIKAGTEMKLESGTQAGIEAGTQLDLKGATGATLQSNARAEVKAPMVNVGQ